ncbi:L-rhamnose mutarotase [Sphingobacterium sp. SGR-19]|uniref:L-rhamnose mutarotase n=1 Tax=Sphingobacterium sp. SGR-19 TaxID=2710886 RepID=UPI0013EAB8BA|nr:right-handed parallel beta-helix repeat-containing protein [Sphingobacterium sp. SGR-19]NGM64520.1 L-rhamnose mutarotase [Sphingobacterium sp. SGR-19]
MKISKKIVWLIGMLCVAVSASAADIYVGRNSRNGSQDGSTENPYGSLEDAIRHARELRRLNDPSISEGINIWVKPGIYFPEQTIRLRPEDTGTAASPTRIRPLEGKAVFSGGRAIHGWSKLGKQRDVPSTVSRHIYVADAPKVGGKRVNFRQLWVNNKKAIRAESHGDMELPRILNWNFDKQTAIIPNVFERFEFVQGMEFFIHQWWAIAQLRVKDAVVYKDSIELSFYQPESKIQSEHPWPKPWLSKESGNSAFRLVNALQFLDKPGEWFLDEDAGKVYYYARDGEDMARADVIFPFLETILEIEGTLEDPVSHVHIEGLSFEHAAWFRPNTHGHVALQAGMYFHEAYKLDKPGTSDKAGLENQAWVGRPASAVVLKNTSYVQFQRCTFSHLASTGFDFYAGNFRDRLEGNIFYDIGGNAVLIGKFSDDQFEAHLPYEPQDERELTREVIVRNNLIHNTANEDWGAVGIGAGFVQGVDISHNDISDIAYSGISLGWGWTPTVNVMKNNTVERNRIARYGKFMYDVAGIYTLSAQPGTKIRENEIDSIYVSPYAHIPDHWFYLYTDEGSAYMDVSNNWFPENKILKNANGPGVIWENNGPEADRTAFKAGLEKPFRDLLKRKEPVKDGYTFNQYIPFTKPVFVQLHDAQQALSKEEFAAFAKAQGIAQPKIYAWGDYLLLMTDDEHAKKLSSAMLANYPKLPIKMFNDLFYTFDKAHCAGQEEKEDVDFVILTAQLVEDEHKQLEYFQYHKKQFEEWPEVAAGFCNAGFQEVLLYRHERQLLLYISFPKGKDFTEIDALTTKDNPRVVKWNQLMSTYQEGVPGTAANETWIFYKR